MGHRARGGPRARRARAARRRARKDVAGYDLRSLLGRLRGHARDRSPRCGCGCCRRPGGVAARRLLRDARGGLRRDRRARRPASCPRRSSTPTATRRDRRAPASPAACRPGRVRGAGRARRLRAEVEAQRRGAVEALADGASRSTAVRRAALWRWRDGFDGASPRCAARRSARTSRAARPPARGLSEFAGSPRGTACGRAAGATPATATSTPTSSSTPHDEREPTRAEAAADELFALAVSLGGSIAGEHGVGWLKRGRLEANGTRARRLHEQIKRAFDPKGLLNPGKKLAVLPDGDGRRWPVGERT